MELFQFDITKARTALAAPDGLIRVVSGFADADELNGLVEGAVEGAIVARREAGSYIHVYPLSIGEPDPVVAVVPPEGPALLGYTLKLRGRQGESPVDFTVRVLEEIVTEANALSAQSAEAPTRRAGMLKGALREIASELPTDEDWHSAADFMEYACAVLDRIGIERPVHYEDR